VFGKAVFDLGFFDYSAHEPLQEERAMASENCGHITIQAPSSLGAFSFGQPENRRVNVRKWARHDVFCQIVPFIFSRRIQIACWTRKPIELKEIVLIGYWHRACSLTTLAVNGRCIIGGIVA
jgi:hypothetical protein